MTQEPDYEALFKERDQQLKDLVYKISHDMRSPLVGIMGCASEISYIAEDILQHTKTLEGAETVEKIASLVRNDIPDAVTDINKSVQKTDDLLAGILKLSRIINGRPNSKKQYLPSTVQRILGQLKHKYSQPVTVESVDLPSCKGDEKLIDHVFRSILENAFSFRKDEGEHRISITGKIEETLAIYTIEDNGVGIDPDNLSSVTNILWKHCPQNPEALGLGLCLAKSSIEKMGGDLLIQSEKGEWTKVTITLPAA